MQKTQLTGAIIMVVSVFQMVLFLWAVARRSYLALALPVMGALAAVSALAFWIGWTLFTSEGEEEESLEEMAETG